MRQQPSQRRDIEDQNPAGRIKRRVIDREEYELPAESSLWSNLAITTFGLAVGVAVAALDQDRPVLRGVLWTLGACLAIGAAVFFFVHRDVNRGRRPRRSLVIEEVVDQSGWSTPPANKTVTTRGVG
jgi:hypothetical protein